MSAYFVLSSVLPGLLLCTRLVPDSYQQSTRAYLLCTVFSTQWRKSRVAGLAHKTRFPNDGGADRGSHKTLKHSHCSPELVSLGQPVTNAAPTSAHKWRGFENNFQIPMNIFVASNRSLQADFCCHKECVLPLGTCIHPRYIRHTT